MEPADWIAKLIKALGNDQFVEVTRLVETMDPELFDLEGAEETLKLLRGKRLFDELEIAAMNIASAGLDGHGLTQYHAQALLDQGRVPVALAMLRRRKAAVADDAKYGPEIRGLIGRGLKQLFVDRGDADSLARAIDAYAEDGSAAPEKHRWHGINLVACMMRGDRDGIPVPHPCDAKKLAAGLVEKITQLAEGGQLKQWDAATALEAAVALDDRELALKWLPLYVNHPGSDAFELGSTLRQLKEIWQLEGTDLGGLVLPVIESKLLEQRGGVVPPPSAVQDDEGFEAVYGDDSAQQMLWLDNLREACRGIGRMQSASTGQAAGTGFLANGSWFGVDAWKKLTVLVTNSHVVSERALDEAPLRPDDAACEFTRLEGRPRVDVGQLLYSSPRQEHDIAIFEIEPPAGAPTLDITHYQPKVGEPGDAARVFVAGHGEGQELSVTFYDNELRQIKGPYARYRSPTSKGHSGSPVLNETWKTFALHHRAIDAIELNEGVIFEAIREAIQGDATIGGADG